LSTQNLQTLRRPNRRRFAGFPEGGMARPPLTGPR
jgi:hypothetical protein